MVAHQLVMEYREDSSTVEVQECRQNEMKTYVKMRLELEHEIGIRMTHMYVA